MIDSTTRWDHPVQVHEVSRPHSHAALDRTVHVLVPLPRSRPWDEDAEEPAAKALCNGDTNVSGCYLPADVARFGDRACVACLTKAGV